MAKMKAALVLEGRDVLVDLCYRRNPRRGHPAAVREAMAELGPEGRRRVAEAEDRVATKAVKRRMRESAVVSAVRETLTAAAAPTRPGAGMAPAVPGGDGGSLMDALRPGFESPFWVAPGGAAIQGAPVVPAEGLHALDSDELRDFAGSAFGSDAQARGFGSPIWAG